ncbi:protein translocase subunit SecF [Treponema phagedenis]|uniref:Protein-export membrane protein SecF n=1 Tax=Treponema phagedenis TaxID=162 RepID=A0A0B7GZZ2_TREPH|nr:protein translocase subunit SecF [Treponema phagedenis]EFW38322.1 export membrane protein SecF [Treponema phagedenis F0421]NVP25045.1 protein translocase subunit SecF [Treponema phagedenis]QEJ94041.1 protein translocase subunit SecF [Treponema phagedenis]QEJ97160.1 protein translocase subunit SecF [Treponema phagedenis]QEK01949.1 protein translocase subunit SecF [Treponema phagedenis]
MKKVIQFSKLFLPLVIFSVVVILSGIIRWATAGINFGIDFQAGFIEKVKIAPPALSIIYNGAKTMTFSQDAKQIDIVSTSVDSENKTHRFPYTEYTTVKAFADAVNKIEGFSVELKAPADTPLQEVFADSQASRLSPAAVLLHYVPSGMAVKDADEIRHALASVPSASVQQVGLPTDHTFQIRLADDGTHENAGEELRQMINSALGKAYGEDNIAVLSTDFVGSRFSNSLARQAFLLVMGALVLIFLYAAIRFQWRFAFGAILALIHDALIMITFIVWTQMEFNSTTIAAILTIIGYSINDTVVVFDRIRENIRINPKITTVDILNLSQTEVLSRTIVTTITTMLAVLMLYIFTSGSMRDFSAALLVGMLSGVYSTVFITSAFIAFTGKNQRGEEILKTQKSSGASGTVI